MLANLKLEQFRSYSYRFFEFSPETNIIVGPNTSGKTNLLEAIMVNATGKSFRVKDPELIQFNKNWYRLCAQTYNGSVRNISFHLNRESNKSYDIDNKIYKRLTNHHKIPLVLFQPNHLLLFSGGSDKRRDYLDDLLGQIMIGYNSLRKQYIRVLTQRNSILKEPNVKPTHLFPWNVRLSELSGQIVRARTNLINQLNQHLTQLYRDLSKSKIKVELKYLSKWPEDEYESRILKELELSLDKDMQLGFTSNGPHREDLKVLFNGRLSHDVASRGETRSILLALKLTELKLLRSNYGVTPLLLLDDVFSELDIERRKSLNSLLIDTQVFLTCTDADTAYKNYGRGSASNTLKLTS